MPRNNHNREPRKGLPSFPDGIEPSRALAALIEAYADERRALAMIVQDAVGRAIEARSRGVITLKRLIWWKTPEVTPWRTIAVAVSKAALGQAGSMREVEHMWGMTRGHAADLLALHHARMTHPSGWFDYKADAEAVAMAVMAEVANCGDEPST